MRRLFKLRAKPRNSKGCRSGYLQARPCGGTRNCRTASLSQKDRGGYNSLLGRTGTLHIALRKRKYRLTGRKGIMLSAKCKYGLKAMVYITRHGDKRPVLIAEIAEAERIPKKFLDVILLEIKTNGMLSARRARAAAISSRGIRRKSPWRTLCVSSMVLLRPCHACPSSITAVATTARASRLASFVR